MDEKNIPVFDFTDERIFDDRGKLDRYNELNTKQRKTYIVDDEPHNGKIGVEIINVDDEAYKCIYKYRKASDICQMIENDESLNLRGIYVKDFNTKEIENDSRCTLKYLNVAYSFWDGDVWFCNVQFENKHAVNFTNVSFNGGRVIFRDVDFKQCVVKFYSTQFFNIKSLIFDDINLKKGILDFTNAQFVGTDMEFAGVNLSSAMMFFECVNFYKCDIDLIVSTLNNAMIDFADSIFENCLLTISENQRVDAELLFKNATFLDTTITFESNSFIGGSMSFNNTQADKVVFINNQFSINLNLNFKKINELAIIDCINEKTIKCNSAAISKLSFVDTINLGRMYIKWDNNIVFNNKNALIEGIRYPAFLERKEPRKHTSEELASQFRMLKENYRNIGYYDDEDKAYRAYMKYKNKGFPKNVWKIFNLIGGYGTQPLRVLLTALVVIFGFAGLQLWQNWIGFVDKTQSFGSRFIEAIYFSGVTFFTIGFGDMAPMTGAAGIATVIEGFLGVALMSYFVVALVRKLLR